jgi:hypothetical protein
MELYFNRASDTTVELPNNRAKGNTDLKVRLIQRIDSSTKSIDFAMYSFNEVTPVKNALINAVARGVKVRMVYDSRVNQAFVDDIIAAGIPVQKRNQNTTDIMHNKFFIFDARDTSSYSDDWLWTGSANITNDQFYSDAENVIFIQDQALCNTYMREFEEMFGSHTNTNDPNRSKFGPNKSDNTPHLFFVNGKRVEVFFSPTDNVSGQIENKIRNETEKSISFCAFAFTRFNISNAMKTQYNPTGYKYVEGVFDDDNATDPSSVYPEMKGIGGSTPWNPAANVRLDATAGLLHSKYILIDARKLSSNPLVETGSFNYSNAAQFGNDENSILIYDSLIVNQYFQDFSQRLKDAGGTLSVQQISYNIPSGYKLEQNYPNPFNPSTKIIFSVSERSNISIKLYDILGRELSELVNGYFESGTYNVNFNSNTLSNGTYFYKMTSDKFTDVKKMTLIK